MNRDVTNFNRNTELWVLSSVFVEFEVSKRYSMILDIRPKVILDLKKGKIKEFL